MGAWRILITVMGCVYAVIGHCNDGHLWLIEQEFVKFGKKDAYEGFKKEHQQDFAKTIPFSRFVIEDPDSSQFIYLIPVGNFKKLEGIMHKRASFQKSMTMEEEKQLLPFLSTVNFFIETLHHYLPGCSFVPAGREGFLNYAGVYFTVYGLVPGSGSTFEEKLRSVAEMQKSSNTPVCFRTWRLLFGGEIPPYVIAVFADTPKEAKEFAKSLPILEGQMRNLLRQEKKGSGLIRKDLSIAKGKD